MNSNELLDVKALVTFGKWGLTILSIRMLSIISLIGLLAISGYSVYAQSWQGVGAALIVALFTFIPSLKAEIKRDAANMGNGNGEQ